MKNPNPIASRILRYRRNDGRQEDIVVALHTPVLQSNQVGQPWMCAFEITAFGQQVQRKIFGIDAMQALVLALHTLPTELRSLAETEAGEFVDDPALGLDRACRANLGEPATPAVEEFVAGCVRALSGPNADDAWHRLIEMGCGALPSIMRAAALARETEVRVKLIRAISEHRATETAVFLGRFLSNEETEVWKTALDALVNIGGSAALSALHDANEVLDAERQSWVAEAVRQIKEKDGPG